MKLSALARELKGAVLKRDAEITSLATDSRVAGEGDLFFCIRGTRSDSHLFADEAEARGAAAIMSERDTGVSIPQLIVKDAREGMALVAAAFYGHPERDMSLVGVTGTNGKTTVTHMLYEIFSAAGIPCGRIGTLGAKYAGAEVPPALTTPDPVALFSLLADMKRAGTRIVAMEVSAHALALKKIAPICYDAAIFTNFTQDHLDFFKDMQTYGAAKRLLFSPEHCREAILNADDEFSRTLGEVSQTTYGIDCPADCFAIVEEETIAGTRMLLNLEDDLAEVTVPMAGKHNVSNALAAATCAHRLGISCEDIADGLSRVKVEGRLERVGERNGASIFVDFAHTPDGIGKSLSALRPFCKGRLVLLFGCGGNRDREKRPLMGAVAARLTDLTVLTSDNPRFEDPAAILSEIEAGFRAVSENYVAIEEREEATRYAIGLLREGDILLIAGKGGETEQEIMGIKYSYNDKTIVRAILEESDA